MRYILQALMFIVGLQTCYAQDEGEVIFSIKKKTESPERGIYYYRCIRFGIEKTDTIPSVIIKINKDTLFYYNLPTPEQVRADRDSVLSPLSNRTAYIKCLYQTKSDTTFIRISPGSRLWNKGALFCTTPNQALKNGTAISGCFKLNQNATHDKVYLTQNRKQVAIGDTVYECIVLLATKIIKQDRGGIAIGGKRLFSGSRNATVVTEYFLRKSDLLPVTFTEHSPVRKFIFASDYTLPAASRTWYIDIAKD